MPTLETSGALGKSSFWLTERAWRLVARALSIVVIVVAVVGAYNAPDWIGHFQYQQKLRNELHEFRSERYHIGDFECYNCFQQVSYWQEKGVKTRGTQAICDNCGFANTYSLDTLPLSDKARAKADLKANGIKVSGFRVNVLCWSCGKMTSILRASNSSPANGARGNCKHCSRELVVSATTKAPSTSVFGH